MGESKLKNRRNAVCKYDDKPSLKQQLMVRILDLERQVAELVTLQIEMPNLLPPDDWQTIKPKEVERKL